MPQVQVVQLTKTFWERCQEYVDATSLKRLTFRIFKQTGLTFTFISGENKIDFGCSSCTFSEPRVNCYLVMVLVK